MHSIKKWSDSARAALGEDTVMSLFDLVMMRSRVWHFHELVLVHVVEDHSLKNFCKVLSIIVTKTVNMKVKVPRDKKNTKVP